MQYVRKSFIYINLEKENTLAAVIVLGLTAGATMNGIPTPIYIHIKVERNFYCIHFIYIFFCINLL